MKTIVIVDAYASGSVLGKKYKELGFKTIHLQSSEHITQKFLLSFTPEFFDVQLTASESFTETLEIIQKYQPEHIIAGTETGVSFSETLAYHCGLPSNKIELLEARRDKVAMVQCAADHGLRVPKSETIQDISELEEAVRNIDSWPVVIKPSASAGTDHVVIAETNTELLETAKKILNLTNQLGLINKKAILQEYISGTEFSVNAVSYEGVTKFTHIWKYHKKEVVTGKFAYDWE